MANPSDTMTDSQQSSSTAVHVRYDDSIVRSFVMATIVWGVLATLSGLFVGYLLVVPTLTGGSRWLSFGRLQPVYANLAMFAFVGNGFFAAVYYSTQRLCKTRMWSGFLSWMHFLAWQAIVLAGALTVPLGMTQGRAYAEWEWPIDVAVAVVWILFFGANFLMTLVRRRERHLYVSLWFYLATIVAFALVHVVSNLVLPSGGFGSRGVFAGVQDAYLQAWYSHHVMAFFSMMSFLGVMYYFLPKASSRGIYSYKLCIVHFWAMVILGAWVAPRLLHYTAMPEWISTLGMLFSLMLLAPSWAGVVNGWKTLGGRPARDADPSLKFFWVAMIFLAITTIEGAVLSIKSTSAMVQYTDWTLGHLHLTLMGWNGFMVFGMVYWLMPRLFQTQLKSDKLANAHFWLAAVGMGLFLVPTYCAGWIQMSGWHSLDSTGNLANPEFVEVLKQVQPFWWLRLIGGVFYLLGLLALGMNAWLTWQSKPVKYEKLEASVVPVQRDERDQPEPESDYGLDVPISAAARKMNVAGKLVWHERWERSPSKFVYGVLMAMLVALVLQAGPLFLFASNIPKAPGTQPYSPLELAGREIYVTEGCVQCHSQTVRPLVPETKRYGDYSLPGEFAYDRPVQWGSRRNGPDLARQGGQRDSNWLLQHLDHPEKTTEGTMMPAYPHLIQDNLDFGAIPELVKSSASLSGYTEQQIEDCEALARRQGEELAAEIVAQGGPAAMHERQAIALIAYLQKLGVVQTASTDQTDSQDQPEAASVDETNQAQES